MTQKLEVSVEFYRHDGINYGVPEAKTIVIPLDELTELGGDVSDWIEQSDEIQFDWAYSSIKLITEKDNA